MVVNFLDEGFKLESTKTFPESGFLACKTVNLKKPKKSPFSLKDMEKVGNQKSLDSSISLCLTNGKPGLFFKTDDIFVFSCSKMTPDGIKSAHADNWVIMIPLSNKAKSVLYSILGYYKEPYEFSVGKWVTEFPGGAREAALANTCIYRLSKNFDDVTKVGLTFQNLMTDYQPKGVFG